MVFHAHNHSNKRSQFDSKSSERFASTMSPNDSLLETVDDDFCFQEAERLIASDSVSDQEIQQLHAYYVALSPEKRVKLAQSIDLYFNPEHKLYNLEKWRKLRSALSSVNQSTQIVAEKKHGDLYWTDVHFTGHALQGYAEMQIARLKDSMKHFADYQTDDRQMKVLKERCQSLLDDLKQIGNFDQITEKAKVSQFLQSLEELNHLALQYIQEQLAYRVGENVSINGQKHPTFILGSRTYAVYPVIHQKNATHLYSWKMERRRSHLCEYLMGSAFLSFMAQPAREYFIDLAADDLVVNNQKFKKEIEDAYLKIQFNKLKTTANTLLLSLEVQTQINSLNMLSLHSESERNFYEVYKTLCDLNFQIMSELERKSLELEAKFLKEVVQEIDVLEKNQNRLKTPAIQTFIDRSRSADEVSKEEGLSHCTVEIETKSGKVYAARAHNHAQQLIVDLVNFGYDDKKQLACGKNQTKSFSIFDKTFNPIEFCDYYIADISKDGLRAHFPIINPNDPKEKEEKEAAFHVYSGAFKAAFTRYYQELLIHAKKDAKRRGDENPSRPYSISRPSSKARKTATTDRVFEFSFEKSPQKENLFVIEQQIKETVSAYQTAFFILGGAKFNQKNLENLENRFKKRIHGLLQERAECLIEHREILSVPKYQIIVSCEKILKISEKGEVKQELLDWKKQGEFIQILSLDNMLNYMIVMTRVLKRYLSMLTSAHQAMLIFKGKIGAYNTDIAKVKNTESEYRVKAECQKDVCDQKDSQNMGSHSVTRKM